MKLDMKFLTEKATVFNSMFQSYNGHNIFSDYSGRTVNCRACVQIKGLKLHI
jgi:hypothetical protein